MSTRPVESAGPVRPKEEAGVVSVLRWPLQVSSSAHQPSRVQLSRTRRFECHAPRPMEAHGTAAELNPNQTLPSQRGAGAAGRWLQSRPAGGAVGWALGRAVSRAVGWPTSYGGARQSSRTAWPGPPCLPSIRMFNQPNGVLPARHSGYTDAQSGPTGSEQPQRDPVAPRRRCIGAPGSTPPDPGPSRRPIGSPLRSTASSRRGPPH